MADDNAVESQLSTWNKIFDGKRPDERYPQSCHRSGLSSIDITDRVADDIDIAIINIPEIKLSFIYTNPIQSTCSGNDHRAKSKFVESDTSPPVKSKDHMYMTSRLGSPIGHHAHNGCLLEHTAVH